MVHYRAALQKAGIASTWQVKQMRSGQFVKVAGMVTVRQRPETAKGILFMSIEDESGLLDVIVYPNVYARLRPTLRHELLIVVAGVVQRDGLAVNVLLQEAEPLTSAETITQRQS
jgi:error-prone DNA polymerase